MDILRKHYTKKTLILKPYTVVIFHGFRCLTAHFVDTVLSNTFLVSGRKSKRGTLDFVYYVRDVVKSIFVESFYYHGPKLV